MNLFPNANFTVCIPSKCIDRVLLQTNTVAIKCEFKCPCYPERIPEFYICKKENFITNRDLINCLIENNFYPWCRCIFLDYFSINTSSQVSACFSS